MEATLLRHALQAALRRAKSPHPQPPDLREALTQLRGTVQGLEEWCNWEERQFGDLWYLAGEYGKTLTDANIENVVNDLVDGLVIFVCEGQPWFSQGTGNGPVWTVNGDKIPIPQECPLWPVLDLSLWLAKELADHCCMVTGPVSSEMGDRRYKLRGPEKVVEWLVEHTKCYPVVLDGSMTSSLSWHPPKGSQWPEDGRLCQDDKRVVKLVNRNEGVYWFGVRNSYAQHHGVQMQPFEQHIIDNVLFNGFWVRNTALSRERIEKVVKQLPCPPNVR